MAEKGTMFGRIIGAFTKMQKEKLGINLGINNATKGKKGFFGKGKVGVVAGRLSKDKPVNNQQGNTLG